MRLGYGYNRLHILLYREGWTVNHKRVYRLYGEEGLALKRRRPKRRKSAATRVARPATTAANERWAMDFVHGTLAGGGSIRVLGVLDVHTCECVALVAARCFRGEGVARVLSQAGDGRGPPRTIQVDNGTECTSCTGPLGLLEPRDARLQPAGKTDGQCGDRVLQRLTETRVSIAALVPQSR